MLKSFWKMCCSPKATIRRMAEQKDKKTFGILSAVYGLPIVLHILQLFSYGSQMSLGLMWIFALLFAPIIGYIAIHVLAFILFWAGKPLKGKGSKFELQQSVAWSNIPMALNIAGWGILTIVFGSQAFTYSFVHQVFSSTQQAVILLFSFMQFVAVIWSLILLLNSLVVIRLFSIQKAILNVAIPYLIFILFCRLVV